MAAKAKNGPVAATRTCNPRSTLHPTTVPISAVVRRGTKSLSAALSADRPRPWRHLIRVSDDETKGKGRPPNGLEPSKSRTSMRKRKGKVRSLIEIRPRLLSATRFLRRRMETKAKFGRYHSLSLALSAVLRLGDEITVSQSDGGEPALI